MIERQENWIRDANSPALPSSRIDEKNRKERKKSYRMAVVSI
jgi:hypothetical protein